MGDKILSNIWDDTWGYNHGEIIELKEGVGVPTILIGTLWKIVLPCFEDRDMHEKYYIEPWKECPRLDEVERWRDGKVVTATIDQFKIWKSNKQTFNDEN